MTYPAQRLTTTIKPEHVRQALAHPNADGTSEAMSYIVTSESVVAQIFKNRERQHIMHARTVAEMAADAAFPDGGYAISEDASTSNERVAATMIVVTAPGMSTANAVLAAERKFYEKIDDLLPEPLIPVVDIVLKL